MSPRLAIKAAKRAPKNMQFRHGAVVTKGGAVLATASNHDGIHAEVAALKKVSPDRRKGCTVWSFRISGVKNNIVANARPCPECLQYMYEQGVKKVYYSAPDGSVRIGRIVLGEISAMLEERTSA